MFRSIFGRKPPAEAPTPASLSSLFEKYQPSNDPADDATADWQPTPHAEPLSHAPGAEAPDPAPAPAEPHEPVAEVPEPLPDPKPQPAAEPPNLAAEPAPEPAHSLPPHAEAPEALPDQEPQPAPEPPPLAAEPEPASPPPPDIGLPAVPAADPLPDIRVLLDDFETLGDNPEMGLVRKQLGASPDGLFGMSTMNPDILRTLLGNRFDRLGDADNLQMKQAFGLYYTTDTLYKLVWQSPIRVEEMDEAHAVEAEVRRFSTLRQRLIKGLETGSRLFVYAGPMADEHIHAIRSAMRGYGQNTLLHLAEADGMHPPRHVEWLAPGLLRGRLSHYGNQPGNWNIALDDWVAICRIAHRLWRAEAV